MLGQDVAALANVAHHRHGTQRVRFSLERLAAAVDDDIVPGIVQHRPGQHVEPDVGSGVGDAVVFLECVHRAQQHAAFRNHVAARFCLDHDRFAVATDKIVNQLIQPVPELIQVESRLPVHLAVRNAEAAAQVDEFQVRKTGGQLEEVPGGAQVGRRLHEQ